MENYIIIAIVVVVLGLAIRYIIKSKKSGKKCIGCPEGCSCSSGQSGCSGNCGGCGGHTDSQ